MLVVNSIEIWKATCPQCPRKIILDVVVRRLALETRTPLEQDSESRQQAKRRRNTEALFFCTVGEVYRLLFG